MLLPSTLSHRLKSLCLQTLAEGIPSMIWRHEESYLVECAICIRFSLAFCSYCNRFSFDCISEILQQSFDKDLTVLKLLESNQSCRVDQSDLAETWMVFLCCNDLRNAIDLSITTFVLAVGEYLLSPLHSHRAYLRHAAINCFIHYIFYIILYYIYKFIHLNIGM